MVFVENRNRSVIQQSILNLNPGYFALVMATGIVSIASYLLEMELVAWLLFGINVVAFIVLWFLTLIRLIYYFPHMLADLASHTRGPGFFTIVAGTCVLGNQFVIIAQEIFLAILLWFLGFILWFILIYSFFAAVFVREKKPPIETGINGAWLIAVVATQAVSILGTLIATDPLFDTVRNELLFFTLSMYLLGCMFYFLIISMIFYRFTFFQLDPKDLTPPYWINMGATAITTLAGATLILNNSQWGFLEANLVFLTMFTLFFWSIGTWWIPLLLIIGAWRHMYKRFPLEYSPLYWGMVFPLGMYTACTFKFVQAIKFAQATDIEFLYIIPRFFVFIALFVWLLTFIGLLHRLMSIFSVSSRQLEVKEI